MTAGTPRWPAWDETSAQPLLAPLLDLPGPLLPALHAVQAHFGCIPAEAVQLLATTFNLSRAEVHGVVSFYDFFRREPPGRRIVRLCQAEACQSMGSEALAAHAKASLGIDFHETTADGAVSLEPVYCLGNCACAPAIMIDERLHGRVSAARLDALLAEGTAP